MAQLTSIIQYLDSLLTPANYKDASLNGLQVQASNDSVEKIAVAVDAGQSVLETAVKEEADLLIVHHGLFWGSLEPITGIFGKKIENLLKGRCSLYASHLPLDAHHEVGNNFELARYFELEQLQECFTYEDNYIGVKGICTPARTIEDFITRSSEMIGSSKPLSLPFGPEKIETVGVVTGGAADLIEQCPENEIDLFITGEPKQSAYHLAKELKINALFAGHYATETFGVRALAERLERDFDLETFFIDEPTGI